ncbi:MAG: hypothetical protein D6799_03000, partial [Bacteroidetes bacterium]
MKKKFIILLWCSIIAYTTVGQSLQDTIHLKDVEVSTSLFKIKDKSFDFGKKIQTTDSVIKSVFDMNALSDVLNYQTSLFVKNYAPGSISSTSVRGGNAQQTAVLWNGININHPMLGQTDISQYASVLFDDISLEYGASSSLWGSGAMNGSLRLNNTFSDTVNTTSLKYRAGSFNTNQLFFKQGGRIKKLKYYSKLHQTQSENNYTIGDSIRLKNSDFLIRDGMLGISYDFKSHHRLETHWWIHSGVNHIPNNY